MNNDDIIITVSQVKYWNEKNTSKIDACFLPIKNMTFGEKGNG